MAIMKNLFISWYDELDAQRSDELVSCIEKNGQLFDNIFVLVESGYVPTKTNNIIEFPVSSRPTFRNYFEVINRVSGNDDINIIANSDIYFESLDFDVRHHQCFALTRYECATGAFLNRRDSQDSWIFRGLIRNVDLMYCSFSLGRPGCDNRIAWELRNAGYEVTNPSLTIKTYHLHSYPKIHVGSPMVHAPYALLEPATL